MTRCLADLAADGAALLAGAGIDSPQRDARRLLAGAMGIGPDRLILCLRDPAAPEVAERFAGALRRRMAREPLSHILGVRAFFKHDFLVTPDVLDPRPETETLVEAALQGSFGTVLDLGTGSGAIVLSLLAERPGVRGLGTDLSPAALAVARQNAARLGLGGRVDFRVSDWFGRETGRFDLIVSNPPYIAAGEMPGLAPELGYEPRMALTDGGDGLSAYRKIVAGAPTHLVDGGRLIVEIGRTQGAAVSALFAAAGLDEIGVLPDLDGRDRVVSATFRAKNG